MMRYTQRIDGVGWEVKNLEIFRISCCDCGLVHDIVLAVPGKRGGTPIGIAVKKNARATAAKRRVTVERIERKKARK